MQVLVRKIYLLFGLFIVTNSYSVGYDCEINVKKSDSLFDAKQYTEALNGYESYIEKTNKVSKSLINKMLFISEMKKDTVKLLTYTTLAYKLYPTADLKMKLDMMTDNFEKGRFLIDFNSWFYVFKLKFIFLLKIIVLIFLVLTFSVGVFLHLKNSNLYKIFFGLSLISCFLMFTLLNIEQVYAPYKHYVLEKDVLLRSKPSYVSDLIVEEVRQGELLLVEKETDIWIEVLYKNQKFYVPQSKKPFLF